MRTLVLNTVALCLVAQLATAQIKLPSPSPGATVMQTVGVTDLTVTYSRPSLKGRTPFTNDLVPYGKVWRTGANALTKFTTTTELMVNGKPLPAGTYALLTMPGADEWSLMFSKNMTQAGDGSAYKPDDDALKVSMKPVMTADNAETFTIDFSNVTDTTAKLNVAWGTVKAVADLMVNTAANAAANVDKAVMDKPEDAATLLAAANYNLAKGRNLEQALAYTDKAIGMKETFRNVWTKAQILAKMGKFAEAVPVAQKALSLGETSGDANFGFMKEGISKGITEYTAKLPAVVPAAVKRKKK